MLTHLKYGGTKNTQQNTCAHAILKYKVGNDVLSHGLILSECGAYVVIESVTSRHGQGIQISTNHFLGALIWLISDHRVLFWGFQVKSMQMKAKSVQPSKNIERSSHICSRKSKKSMRETINYTDDGLLCKYSRPKFPSLIIAASSQSMGGNLQ